MDILQNPINRMILEERRKVAFDRVTGAVALLLGADLIAIAFTSQEDTVASPGSIMPVHALGIIAGVGGIVAFLAGILVIRYKYSMRFLLWVSCSVALLCGLAFLASEVGHPSNLQFVAFHSQYWLSIVLATIVTWFTWKKA